MIGATGLTDRDGGGAEIFKRRQPRLEHRAHHIVVLQVHAADLARTVIQIKVAG